MVDVEKIMQEIRDEIKEKSLDKDIPSFGECPRPNACSNIEMRDEEFDIDYFLDYVNRMNGIYWIQPNKGIGGKRVFRFIKKGIRKLTRFYIEPIVNDQTEFNVCTVRVVNSIRNYILKAREVNERMDKMTKRIEMLEEALKKTRR